eukprot:SAG11_NODE_2542_length_3237_cov_1.924841_4_plen_71_part_00
MDASAAPVDRMIQYGFEGGRQTMVMIEDSKLLRCDHMRSLCRSFPHGLLAHDLGVRCSCLLRLTLLLCHC